MADIYEATIVCDNCNTQTSKQVEVKDGFRIRAWKCPKCGKKWLHPADIAEFNEFAKIRERGFKVKLRPVGNSWAVSIPKEIIEFEEVKRTEVVRLSLDEPGRVSIFFTKIRKVIK